MKLVISGSRRIRDYQVVADAIAESGFEPTLIIEGGQRTLDENYLPVGGVDYFAQQWARRNRVKHKRVDAKWSELGLIAGPRRNREMAEMGDALVAIPDPKSKGTRNMILAMTMLGKPIFVKEVAEPKST